MGSTSHARRHATTGRGRAPGLSLGSPLLLLFTHATLRLDRLRAAVENLFLSASLATLALISFRLPTCRESFSHAPAALAASTSKASMAETDRRFGKSLSRSSMLPRRAITFGRRTFAKIWAKDFARYFLYYISDIYASVAAAAAIGPAIFATIIYLYFGRRMPFIFHDDLMMVSRREDGYRRTASAHYFTYSRRRKKEEARRRKVDAEGISSRQYQDYYFAHAPRGAISAHAIFSAKLHRDDRLARDAITDAKCKLYYPTRSHAILGASSIEAPSLLATSRRHYCRRRHRLTPMISAVANAAAFWLTNNNSKASLPLLQCFKKYAKR